MREYLIIYHEIWRLESKYFSPYKPASLRKLALSHNVNGINFATEIFFCKTLVVDEKILTFAIDRGWKSDGQIVKGICFKVMAGVEHIRIKSLITTSI